VFARNRRGLHDRLAGSVVSPVFPHADLAALLLIERANPYAWDTPSAHQPLPQHPLMGQVGPS
jgi:hypothetical protein